MTVLEASGLEKSFGGVQALRGVGFSLGAGELLAMIGPNGAGKSTCFNILNGQLRPDAGGVTLGGESLVGLAPHAIWRKGVGRTFQITATFGSMSVRENVQMALLSAAGGLMRFWRPASSYFRDEAMALLERVGIADQAGRACGILAYGDLKRVELAVALANRPRLLLMDEPTAGMAAAERFALMDLVRGQVEQLGLTVLFTEHSMDVVFGYAQRLLVLSRGRLIADGTPDEVRAAPAAQAAYFGADAAAAP
jgi:branched-chain amino acid transport system ATP-binding protein